MAPSNEVVVDEAYFYSCNSCPRVFFSKPSLEAHARVHRALSLLSLVKRRQPVISLHDIGYRIKKTCPTCNQDIVLAEFSVHIKSHVPVAKIRKVFVSNPTRKNAKWKPVCKICNYSAPSFAHYKNHIRLHKNEPRRGLYNCVHCGAAFPKPSSLRIHTIKKHPSIYKKAPLKVIPKRPSLPLPIQRKSARHEARTARLEARKAEAEEAYLKMPELESNEMDYTNSSNSQSEPPELDMEEDGVSSNYNQNGQNGLTEETCQTCGESVAIANFMEHVASHLEVGQGICTLCDYAAGNKQDLVDHLSTHYNIKAYVCTYCPKAYHWKHSLVRHCVNAHSIGKKLHQCSVCDKVFATAKEETRHALTHITERERQTKPEGTPFQAINEIPVQPTPPPPPPPPVVKEVAERKYKCQYCFKGFHKKKQCNAHETIHRRAERATNNVSSQVINRIFNRGSSVINKPKRKKNNSSNSEVDVDRTIRQCKTCGEQMLLSDLLVHIKNHVTKDQRQCDLCRHVYANVESLREHMHTHYGLEPHRCMICGRTYSLKQSVLNHIIRNHKAAKPLEFYSCTIPPSPKPPKDSSSGIKDKHKNGSSSPAHMRTPNFSPAVSGLSSFSSGIKPQQLRFQQDVLSSPVLNNSSSSYKFQLPIVEPKKPPRPINFQCNFCQRVFTTKFSVQRHEAKLHDYIDTDNKRVYKTTYAPEDSDTNGMESQSSESSDNPHWSLENGFRQSHPDLTLSCYNVSSNGEILTNDYGIPFRTESLQSEIRGLLLEQDLMAPEVSVREIPAELY